MYQSLILASTDRQGSLKAGDVPILLLKVWCHCQSHDAAWNKDNFLYGMRCWECTRTALVFPFPKFSSELSFELTIFSVFLYWTFSAWDMRAIGRRFPLSPEWDDYLKYRLIRPISCNLDVNTSYGSCAVCSFLPGSLIHPWICWLCVQYSGPYKILGVPQESSSAWSADIFNFSSSNSSTEELGTILLGIALIHNVVMAIVPRGRTLSASDSSEKKMSSVKVTLWHSWAYLNITNFMLNIHRA